MNEISSDKKDDFKPTLQYYYYFGIAVVVVLLTILRIIFGLSENLNEFERLRDIDFQTLRDHSDRGLINYYNGASYRGFRAIYLYYWYFIFFPVYLLPFEIGIYVWDILRLISIYIVAQNIHKIARNGYDRFVFFVISGIGFFADAYLNNTNWIIQLLLFESYRCLQNDKKWLSGIFFAIACYKINVIIFPLLLLIIKKIKLKDLIYYAVPLTILCLPYIIFPEYFMQMYHNWTYVEEGNPATSNIFLQIYLISWQAFQTAQLMFIAILVAIFLGAYEGIEWKKYFRWVLLAVIILINLSFPFILWQLT
ncbi:MAG: glycosyltransferase 87 family protein [Promethearchaeota archaeon]